MNRQFKRLSLMERSALTLQSYLNGDFHKRFYSDEFLAGICRTRYEIHMATGKAGGYLMLSSLALAYFDLLPSKVTIFSNEFPVSHSMIPILNVFASASLFYLIIKFIESMLIDKYISRIGENIKIYSFDLFLLDKNPVNIWVEPLIPRYFGERSGAGHKGVLPILGIFMIILYAGILILVVALISKTAFSIFFASTSEISAKLMSVAAILFVILSVLVVVSYSIQFKFYDAHFDEYTMEPTEALQRKLEEEMGAQPTEAQQDKTA